jgi:hypothetical protein
MRRAAWLPRTLLVVALAPGPVVAAPVAPVAPRARAISVFASRTVARHGRQPLTP